MKTFLLSALAIGASAALGLGVLGELPTSSARAVEPSGFAVLELFTSEGCSSCPAADDLLSELADQYADQNVIPLAFHVDYWDGLGWRDPFSAAAFSARQRSYASSLGGRIYTPQLVVNGRAETVGSRASMVRSLIASALARPSAEQPAVELTTRAEQGSIEVRPRVLRAPAGAELSLLLVQRHARSTVTRGENASRVLTHRNVVRSLTLATGTTRLALPAGLHAEDVFVVGLLTQDHAVIAGARS